MQVNMLEAKTQLPKLVDAVLRGEEVVIANRGRPVVRLVKTEEPKPRRWGAWEGLMTDAQIDHAFSPEVDAELAREWSDAMVQPVDPAGPLRSRVKAVRKAPRKRG